jgi:hypothetical protein
MRFFPANQTDLDWRDQFTAQEHLRHELREHQDSMVGPRESTPLHEPVPPATLTPPMMSLLRERKFREEVERMKRDYNA